LENSLYLLDKVGSVGEKLLNLKGNIDFPLFSYIRRPSPRPTTAQGNNYKGPPPYSFFIV